MEILFENGKPKLQSHCGVLLGLFMVVILIAYGTMKLNIMLDYLDNKIQEPTIIDNFSSDYLYDSRDGWRVAFGLIAYDKTTDQTPFDDSFGRLVAY